MKYILLFCLALSLSAGDTLPADRNYKGSSFSDANFSINLYAFGKSYHTNREVGYRETNPGLGVGITLEKDDDIDWTLAGGFYRDSFNKPAHLLLMGPQIILGSREGFHVSPGFLGGYLKGSGSKGGTVMPILAIGYNKFDVCVTGDVNNFSGDSVYYNNDGSIDKENSGTRSIAFFVKVNLIRF